ncbi:MAG: cobyric acid synthase CobQ, partial [Clostridia bacterium]|nr:cobyric acid synthase CobQ [Clostridia bacterium]
LAPFERYENVSVRYVVKPGELGEPDMIVIPGTKSTISDLVWLRESGLEAKVKQAASRGTPVFGICGGYQMLGESVSDPEGVEASGLLKVAGMGLLPIETVFEGEKVQRQTSGVFNGIEGIFAGLNGLGYEGYEIHMGRSGALAPVINRGAVYGSYVHGIFDAKGIAEEILRALCERKGAEFEELGSFDPTAYREAQYDKLADAVREGLDMELVYRIVRGEV